MKQTLSFATVRMQSTPADDQPYVIAGARMYAIGMLSGAPPRIGAEHLVGEMGGLWAQPFKALSHWRIAIDEVSRRAGRTAFDSIALDSASFHGAFWRVERVRGGAALRVRETEWIDEDDAVLFLTATVTNQARHKRRLAVRLDAQPDLRPCWMGRGLRGETLVTSTAREIAARNPALPGCAVVVRGTTPLRAIVTLAPGASHTLCFAVAAVQQGGAAAARALAIAALNERELRSRAKQRRYRAALRAPQQRARGGPAALDLAYDAALLNLKMLETRNAAGHYAIAGLPEYPNLFGCDIAYSIPGLCAAGRVDLAQSSLRALACVADRQCGRVPHEVVPDGGVFHPGNAQETPQFVSAVHHVWVRLRARRQPAAAWLREMYPVCRAALLNYARSGVLSANSRFPHYPQGDAMVERPGMLPLKLDSVCYTWRALQDMLAMSAALGEDQAARHMTNAADAAALHAWAAAIAANFERDWWIERAGFYADSLGWDGEQRLDRHWTQAVPLETGLARASRARPVLARIERDWLSSDGLPHTVGVEASVWTLPTGVLALGAARLGRRALAQRLLADIAKTLAFGQLGLFEELIPRGLCFAQLWSAALFVQIYEALGNDAVKAKTRIHRD